MTDALNAVCSGPLVCHSAPQKPAAPRNACCSRGQAEGAAYCPGCGGRLRDADGTASPSPASAPSGTSSPPIPPTPTRADEAASQPPASPPAAASPAPSPSRPTCRCGATLPPDARFCHQCASPVAMPSYRVACVSNGPIVQTLAKGATLTIGKAEACDCVVPNDIYVSRSHARVTEANGFVFLEDLGSSNGSFVRVRRPVQLFAGDEFLIGTTLFRVEA